MNDISIKLGSINPYQFFSDINEQLIKDGLAEIEKQLLKRDKEIFLSDKTRRLGFKPKGFKSRYFITLLGTFRIKIHRYKFWDESTYNKATKNYGKWRYKFLLLEDLKFEKYQKITHDLKELILTNIDDCKRIKDIINMIPVKSLSYSEVARIISHLDFDLKSSSNNFSTKTSFKYIYIVLDDTFLSLKEKNKKFQIRISFFIKTIWKKMKE